MFIQHVDNSSQFSRVQQFGPKFEICRGQGYCFKRLFIHGHDGTRHTFAVQVPAGRFVRREERVMQLFRTLSLYVYAGSRAFLLLIRDFAVH